MINQFRLVTLAAYPKDKAYGKTEHAQRRPSYHTHSQSRKSGFGEVFVNAEGAQAKYERDKPRDYPEKEAGDDGRDLFTPPLPKSPDSAN